MKPVINFVLRTVSISLNQNMLIFEGFLSEHAESFISTFKRRIKNDKR